MVECGQVDHNIALDNMGDLVVALDKSLDTLSECRLRHKALIDFERNRK